MILQINRIKKQDHLGSVLYFIHWQRHSSHEVILKHIFVKYILKQCVQNTLLYCRYPLFFSESIEFSYHHSDKSHWAERSWGSVNYLSWNHVVWPFRWKLPRNTVLALLLRCTNWFQSLILETKSYGVSIHITDLERHFNYATRGGWDHSIESYWAVLCCGTV